MSLRAAALREVIVTEHLRGNGSPVEPMRIVTTYWAKDGTWLAENDPTRDHTYRENGSVPERT